MKIKATRLITEEAEIGTPSWFKKGVTHYCIMEHAIIEVTDGQITRWSNDVYKSPVFQSKALEASTGEEITREEFEQKYSDVVASFDSVVNALPEEKEEKPILITEAQKWADIR